MTDDEREERRARRLLFDLLIVLVSAYGFLLTFTTFLCMLLTTTRGS